MEINQPQTRNWWDRNWKWFVPVGCLSLCVLLVGFVALIMSLAFGMMKSSDVYKEAVVRTRANPAVVSALGIPLKEGYFISGNINISGPSGTAELAIPVSGPKGNGTVYLEARKSAGEWTFSKLVVKIEQTGQRIDLLDGKQE
jgi:hypothetical protein